MIWTLVKAAISAAVIVAVAEVSGRIPRLGALLLTLPIVSILAFIVLWSKEGEMTTITQLARETLVLVPLGLRFSSPSRYPTAPVCLSGPPAPWEFCSRQLPSDSGFGLHPMQWVNLPEKCKARTSDPTTLEGGTRVSRHAYDGLSSPDVGRFSIR